MNGAAVIFKKVTLSIERLAQSQQSPVPNHVLSLKLLSRHAEKTRGLYKVLFTEINEAAYFAALRASGLTFEAHDLSDCKTEASVAERQFARTSPVGSAPESTPGAEPVILSI